MSTAPGKDIKKYIRQQSPSFQHAIEWITDNDETAETSIDALETLVSVTLVADLWGKTPRYVATRVYALRCL